MNFDKFDALINDAYNYEECLERQGLKQEDVELLREKMKRSKLVPRFIHDKQLLLFVNAAKDDMDRGSKWIHVYYKMKLNSPEFFSNRDVLSDGIQAALKNQIYVTLPVTNSCNVILHKLINTDPKTYVFDEAIKTFCMTAEALTFRSGPRDGNIFIYDLKGGGFRHLLQPSIGSVRKGLDFLQTGSPLYVTAVHVFNSNVLMNFIFTMIRPFLKKELYERIHLHAGSNYEEFFEKHIPRAHMPSEYGGDLESSEVLHEKNRKALLEMRDYFLVEEEQMKLNLDHNADNNNNGDDDFYDAENEEESIKL